MAFIPLLLVLTALAVWLLPLRKRETPIDDEVWAQALESDSSAVSRALLSASRPLSKLPAIYEAETSRQYAGVYQKVLASGKFGGSLEVWLSVQALTIIIALVVLAGLAAVTTDLTMAAVVGALAVLIAYYPYHIINSAAKKRADAVTSNLPDFAEVLLMSLTAGVSIMQALRFTATEGDVQGPVAVEVKNMLDLMATGSVEDRHAFEMTGNRLGTPESVAFFNALAKAHLDGSKVVETINAQANTLRVTAFQNARGEAKKLPTKLTLITFIHLMSGLLLIGFLPVVITLMNGLD